MTDKVYIDGIDIYEYYGVFVIQNGYNDMIAFPQLVEPESNDWFEEDGLEVDLSNPVLSPYSFKLKMASSGADFVFNEFLTFLNSSVYHEFYFKDIERRFIFRISDSANNSQLDNLRLFDIVLFDDFPVQRLNYLSKSLFPEFQNDELLSFGLSKVDSIWSGNFNPATQSSTYPDTGYLIDDVDFKKFNLKVLGGTLASFNNQAPVKDNLQSKISDANFQFYDDGVVRKKQGEIELNCLITADNLSDLWESYDSLLYTLMQPNERVIESTVLQRTYIGYYDSCKINYFSYSGKMWIDFTLGFKINRMQYNYTIKANILGTEDGKFISTENGKLIQLGDNYI